MTLALFFILPGVAIFLFLLGIYKIFFEEKDQARENVLNVLSQKQAQKALTDDAGDASILKKRAQDKKSLKYLLEPKLEHANWVIKPNEFLLICLAVAATLFFLFMISGVNMGLAIMAGIAGLFAPYGVLLLKIMLRMKKADQQFPDVLDTMVNCFKTGYGINRALQTVAEKFQDPWGTEFEKLIAEINLGSTFEDAVEHLCDRVPLADVELFVSAMLIQKDTGGNLGEILANISNACRNRYKLYRKVTSLTAQGKLSAIIVSCIPFFLISVMFAALPKATMDFISNPIGILLTVVIAIWMLFGYSVLFKIVQIEV